MKSSTDEQRSRIAKELQPSGLGAGWPAGFVAPRSRGHYGHAPSLRLAIRPACSSANQPYL